MWYQLGDCGTIILVCRAVTRNFYLGGPTIVLKIALYKIYRNILVGGGAWPHAGYGPCSYEFENIVGVRAEYSDLICVHSCTIIEYSYMLCRFCMLVITICFFGITLITRHGEWEKVHPALKALKWVPDADSKQRVIKTNRAHFNSDLEGTTNNTVERAFYLSISKVPSGPHTRMRQVFEKEALLPPRLPQRSSPRAVASQSAPPVRRQRRHWRRFVINYRVLVPLLRALTWAPPVASGSRHERAVHSRSPVRHCASAARPLCVRPLIRARRRTRAVICQSACHSFAHCSESERERLHRSPSGSRYCSTHYYCATLPSRERSCKTPVCRQETNWITEHYSSSLPLFTSAATLVCAARGPLAARNSSQTEPLS